MSNTSGGLAAFAGQGSENKLARLMQKAILKELASNDSELPPSLLSDDDDNVGALAQRMRNMREEFLRFRMEYDFAIQEVLTKVKILWREFEQVHEYSPIEHVRSRLKTIESLMEKMQRTDCPPEFPTIREQIRDIAGIRITCSFISDVYWIADMLQQQPDLNVLTVKDYIAKPKDNGYRSLHLIVEIPVFLSTGAVNVPVELQIRTIAMDFWASTEHKLSYKYRYELPNNLIAELGEAAVTARELDERMSRLRSEILGDYSSSAR